MQSADCVAIENNKLQARVLGSFSTDSMQVFGKPRIHQIVQFPASWLHWHSSWLYTHPKQHLQGNL